MTSTQSLKAAIEASVHHHIDVANEKLNMDMPYPTIKYTVKGGKGGTARGSREVNFNMGLIVDNLNEYLNHVVPHEVAHTVVNFKWGQETRITRGGKIQRVSHGEKFRTVMRLYGIYKSAYSTHNMDTSKVKSTRNTAKFAVVCTGCGFEGTVGKKRAEKIRNGSRYVHSCGNRKRAVIKLA